MDESLECTAEVAGKQSEVSAQASAAIINSGTNAGSFLADEFALSTTKVATVNRTRFERLTKLAHRMADPLTLHKRDRPGAKMR